MSDIKAKLLAACKGHPAAEIPWPHRLLHDAIEHIESQQANIDSLTADSYRQAGLLGASIRREEKLQKRVEVLEKAARSVVDTMRGSGGINPKAAEALLNLAALLQEPTND